jgi:hypothetical protein
MSTAADERDEAEEAYWREFCPGCGVSPCQLPDGETDEFHSGEPPDLDSLATRLTYAILLASFAEYGVTSRAFGMAAEAVLGTTAIAGGPCAMKRGE